MAAYASSITLYTPNTQRISRSLGMLTGEIDITNYNSTTTEETDITDKFLDSGGTGMDKGILSLQITSSEKGYILQFDPTTGKFKAYEPGSNAIGNATVAATTVTITAPTTLASGSVTSVASLVTIADLAVSSLRARTQVALSSGLSAQLSRIVSGVDALTVTQGVAVEVANDTDLGTFRFTAIGLAR